MNVEELKNQINAIDDKEIADALFRNNIVELNTESMQIIWLNNYDDVSSQLFITFNDSGYVNIGARIMFGMFYSLFNGTNIRFNKLHRIIDKDAKQLVECVVEKINNV